MKNNYLRFALKIFLLICTTTVFIFVVVGFLVIKEFDWDQDAFNFLQSIMSVCLIVWVMCLVVGLPSFFVKVNSSGISKRFRPGTLSWSNMDHAKIVGVAFIKHFNKMVLSGHGQTVEISLFIFDDQEKFVKDIGIYLPWATCLDLKSLPSEASK